jgi:hypothetical protein
MSSKEQDGYEGRWTPSGARSSPDPYKASGTAHRGENFNKKGSKKFQGASKIFSNDHLRALTKWNLAAAANMADPASGP